MSEETAKLLLAALNRLATHGLHVYVHYVSGHSAGPYYQPPRPSNTGNPT